MLFSKKQQSGPICSEWATRQPEDMGACDEMVGGKIVGVSTPTESARRVIPNQPSKKQRKIMRSDSPVLRTNCEDDFADVLVVLENCMGLFGMCMHG